MLNNNEYLNKLYQSDKPLIIYKTDKGFDIFTDFSHKEVCTQKNQRNNSSFYDLKIYSVFENLENS